MQVYVPMQDTGNHFFLMVLCMQTKKVYHLNSFLTEDVSVSRRESMTKVVSQNTPISYNNFILTLLFGSYF